MLCPVHHEGSRLERPDSDAARPSQGESGALPLLLLLLHTHRTTTHAYALHDEDDADIQLPGCPAARQLYALPAPLPVHPWLHYPPPWSASASHQSVAAGEQRA